MRRIGLVVAVLLLAAGAGASFLLLRPGASAVSTVDADVAVECTAATGVAVADCQAWGDRVLAEGAPTTTFEAQDVVRLRIDRELLGFGDTCRAEWFLGRYPEDVAWSGAVACADG